MVHYNPYLWPDGRIIWIRAPVILAFHLTFIPTPPQINLRNTTVMQPLVVDKRQAGAEAKQNKVLAPDKTEARENLRKHLRVPSGPPSTWEKNLKFEPCEDCMAVLASLCSEVTEDVEKNRRDESKTTENSFLQYMEELCEDTDFVTNVESNICSDFLDSLLSEDPYAFDRYLEQQQQEQKEEVVAT